VRATENELYSRRLLYAGDMNLVHQALKVNNLGRARRLLDRHRPASAKDDFHADLRGWEWRYFWLQSQSDALSTVTQRGHRVFSVSFSRDGGTLAIGHLLDRVELWDLARGQLIQTLREDAGNVAHVAFSPRSDLLVFSGEGGEILMQDLRSGQESMLGRVAGGGASCPFQGMASDCW
jgi:WD40 repeat protein